MILWRTSTHIAHCCVTLRQLGPGLLRRVSVVRGSLSVCQQTCNFAVLARYPSTQANRKGTSCTRWTLIATLEFPTTRSIEYRTHKSDTRCKLWFMSLDIIILFAYPKKPESEPFSPLSNRDADAPCVCVCGKRVALAAVRSDTRLFVEPCTRCIE